MLEGRGLMQTTATDALADHAELCLDEAFDRQAAHSPNATAVVDGTLEINYAELQYKAQRLAFKLREAGVGPDVPVGLLAERSCDAVIGILGILKAGGAYVPINPHDPEARITAIIEDSGAALTLVQPHLRPLLRTAADVIELNGGAVAHAHSAITMTPASTLPTNLAVIVYSSGSTGPPKGIEISHRSIMARARNGYRPRRGDLQKAPLSVVAHFSDLVLPLMSGGPVIFLPDSCFNSGRALSEVICRQGTSRMVFVPSQLSAFMEGGKDAVMALGRLDSVIVSGEPLSPSLVRGFKRRLPHVALVNAYGASEVAGLVCMGEVRAPEDITVGHPIPGCAVGLLDEDLNPVPDGAEGEVYIAGAQVARGYRRNPGLTAERFLARPSGSDGGPVYRTGDRAQRLKDGRIRIVGRCDFEVKIHGFRVNVNEVEGMLEGLPGVQRAVVAVHTAADQTRLLAFVLPQPSCKPADAAMMRTALAEQLPAYMVPSQIRCVTTFPLTPNGKVDRVALATSDSRDAASGDAAADSYIAPRTVTERVLADIWRSLLGVSRIGATDDFFALGGDSLDATRFILRAEALGVIVTPEQLEDASSLETLALTIDRSARDRTRSQTQESDL